MDFIQFVEQIPNITIAKRIASAYVADYRRLELNEIKEFLIKTAKQYTSYENIANRLDEIKLDSNRAIRLIAPVLLRDYLLDQDDFISPCKETDAAVLNYEKMIIDESNNFDINKISKDLALFKYMLDRYSARYFCLLCADNSKALFVTMEWNALINIGFFYVRKSVTSLASVS